MNLNTNLQRRAAETLLLGTIKQNTVRLGAAIETVRGRIAFFLSTL